MAKVEVVHQDSFSFGGCQIFFQMVVADGYTSELIKGKVDAEKRSLTPDYSFARIALLQRMVHKLKVNSKDVDLDPSPTGKSQFPRVWDKALGESLTTRLLKTVVNKVDPVIAEEFPEAFEEYIEEEQEVAAFPTTSTSVRSAPIPPKDGPQAAGE